MVICTLTAIAGPTTQLRLEWDINVAVGVVALPLIYVHSAIDLVTGFPPSIGFMGKLLKLKEHEPSDAQTRRRIPSEGMWPD